MYVYGMRGAWLVIGIVCCLCALCCSLLSISTPAFFAPEANLINPLPVIGILGEPLMHADLFVLPYSSPLAGLVAAGVSDGVATLASRLWCALCCLLIGVVGLGKGVM